MAKEAITVVHAPSLGYGNAMATLPTGRIATGPGDADVRRFCTNALKGVSRTFALSIPELPEPLDDWVRCAYLVCRMIDTLEDRPARSERDRQQMFDRFIASLGPPVDAQAVRDFASSFADDRAADACSALMANADLVLDLLSTFPPPALDAVQRCAVDMAAGLRRTPLSPPSATPRCLFQTMHQLERYCHYAAGVVGVMLARLFVAYLDIDPASINRATLHRAKRFGRGLQLTNITKDHPADLSDGRCFIPAEAARRCACDPSELLQPSLPLEIRALMVRRAAAHLDVALRFCVDLPTEPIGIRLFCVQPMMMALMTLERIITHPDPTPDDRPKITRTQVEEVMTTSRRISHDDHALQAWYGDLRGTLAHLLTRC